MRTLTKVLIGAAVAVVVLAGGAFAAYKIWIESDPEPRATIAETPVTEGAEESELDGAYTVVSGPAETPTFVGYRVTEQLVAAVVEQETTGRTPEVTGTLTISGDTVADVNMTANLLNLQSDDDRRDNAIKTRGLESERFPEATFALTEPIELPANPELGKTVTAAAVGDFTLHGVTNRVEIPIEGRWDGTFIQVIGSLPIVFADYGMEAPTASIVASIDDEGEMEFQIFFQKA